MADFSQAARAMLNAGNSKIDCHSLSPNRLHSVKLMHDLTRASRSLGIRFS
jgi:hypothetical protein